MKSNRSLSNAINGVVFNSFLERENIMSSTEHETPKFLIDLIINQDQVTQKWVEFLIVIQAGLVVMLGFLVRPTDTPTVAGQKLPPHAALYAIPVLGILVALAIGWIVIRERKWTSWYISRFNDLPGFSGEVFPDKRNNSSKNSVKAHGIGGTGRIVTGLAILISLGWIGVILWAWQSR
jgi:hypothetical protein